MSRLLLDEESRENPLTEVGEKAPDFVLKNDKGEEWRLSDQLGQVTALLFYPGDETLVCTKQLCSVRDHWEDYLATKAVVVGVSPGTVSEHQQFSLKHKLPLPLLADQDGRVTEIYRNHWGMPVFLSRAIVVVDAKGIVRSKKIMFRGFRPTDYSVITSIYEARTDALNERFNKIVKKHRLKY